ncbi:hypothetical protein CN617_00505 [Bacillus wiedmannii]|nr:hypothetical protein CN617_00505 [Bacillus wiedmannii]
MMAILSAIYIDGEEKREYKKSEIDTSLYNNHLKGKLYCPTPNCQARLIFNSGLRSYLKTWNNDNHIEGCIHGFDRVKGRIGVDTSHFINVELSSERKKRALKEAFAMYTMTEEEKEKRQNKKTKKKNTPTTVTKQTKPASKVVMAGGVDEATSLQVGVRGPNLSKRTVDMLKEKDTGQTRLLIGIIKDVILDTQGTATIIVVENNMQVCVRFEEAFREGSPNYLGLFHHIKTYISTAKNVVFTGIGEIRKQEENDYFDFSIFNGRDFEIDRMDLRVLANPYR